MSTEPLIVPTTDTTISRRGFFMTLGILFNGFAALVVAAPIARYLLSSVTRGRADAYLSWVPSGMSPSSQKARPGWLPFRIQT